jgi:hypothetical protein
VNTRPPGNDQPRIVWTRRDEEMYLELAKRRETLTNENMKPVSILARQLVEDYHSSAHPECTANDDDVKIMAGLLVSNAAALRDALQPFDLYPKQS